MDTPLKISPPKTPVRRTGASWRACSLTPGRSRRQRRRHRWPRSIPSARRRSHRQPRSPRPRPCPPSPPCSRQRRRRLPRRRRARSAQSRSQPRWTSLRLQPMSAQVADSPVMPASAAIISLNARQRKHKGGVVIGPRSGRARAGIWRQRSRRASSCCLPQRPSWSWPTGPQWAVSSRSPGCRRCRQFHCHRPDLQRDQIGVAELDDVAEDLPPLGDPLAEPGRQAPDPVDSA